MALLEASGVHKTFTVGTRTVNALAGVSISVQAGKTLAVVGESGSGKSTLGSIIAGLQNYSEGAITFDGNSIGDRALRGTLRRRIQMVFQNPLQSLNPKYRVEQTLLEPLSLLTGLRGSAASKRVTELLDMVQLPEELRRRYPGELSGGQQQRVAIARALAPDPDLIVLDEPTSGLDQSVRSHVVELLRQLQDEQGAAYIFITHDIDVARAIAHDAAVMQRGQVVEAGSRSQVLDNPQHPYTQALLAAVPNMDPRQRRRPYHSRPTSPSTEAAVSHISKEK
ncbi:ABC transporter ATP-binding protein [Microbacterium sp. YY-01]|uniref:ABC transporter ATP-binding protein n=1 Tax=Microbacterium sp. YY-01 TaxID=3421634 RepID=UPI003D176830